MNFFSVYYGSGILQELMVVSGPIEGNSPNVPVFAFDNVNKYFYS